MTVKEDLFVQEYLVDLNATQAYLRAYDTDSAKTAGPAGWRLLRKPSVAAKIQAALAERGERLQLDTDYVLFGVQQTIERLESAEQFNPFAILKAYELLGRHLKLFTDKVEVSGLEALADRIRQARENKDITG